MTRGLAVIVAGLAAPVAPAVAFALALVFSFRNGPWALVSFPLWYLVTLVAEVVLGGPLLLIAWRLRIVTWWASALAGGLVGVAVLLTLQSLHFRGASGALLMGALGAAAGLVFWLIARLGRDPAPAVP
jgi:hypothetical protein